MHTIANDWPVIGMINHIERVPRRRWWEKGGRKGGVGSGKSENKNKKKRIRKEKEKIEKNTLLVIFCSTSVFFSFFSKRSVRFIFPRRLVRFRRHEFAGNVARHSFLSEIRRKTHERKK